MDFKINYEKRKNSELFKAFQSEKLTNLANLQNYIPIYNKFFMLNENNYNSINLNNKWYITDVKKQSNDNKNLFKCEVKNLKTSKTKTKELFFKMAPLLDPFKFLIGKYNSNDPNLYNLPKLEFSTNVHPKLLDQNNSAYVDGLFSFITSTLLHNYNFIHGVDYYGSFLGIKNSFKLNVVDDLEYLCKSEYFIKNKNVLFEVEDYSYLFEESSNENKPLDPIKIDHNVSNSNLSVHSINNNLYDEIFTPEHLTLGDLQDLSIDLVDLTNSDDFFKMNDQKTTTLKSGSTCSSRTSHTSNYENSSERDECDDCDYKNDDNSEIKEDNSQCEEDSEDDDDDDTSSGYEEEKIYATIPKFPVQVICMEYCENTFDDLIINEDLSQDEWLSALMQIIMILITYQKTFSLTHNDLHTNNVMYNTTDKEFIYYLYKKKYYRVPTYGRIFKIIDFGRAIYKYNGITFCSDSYQPGGDAATQYNTEPYFNDKKPRLEPNYSFDLCRLACSIFDYIIEDLDDLNDYDSCEPVVKLIYEWCLDDNGINILYKNNGTERYPDFKLYKMIARCVHNHTPQAQLARQEFDNFSINSKDLPKEISSKDIIDIDNIPSFASTM
jgi:hypothetical protein